MMAYSRAVTASDTLVFEHFDTGMGAASQTIVALDLGMAYMHGTASPIIKFAEQKAGYEVDWERLEIRGDSDDTVTVNLGLNTEDAAKFGAGVTGEAQNTDASVDANGNLVATSRWILEAAMTGWRSTSQTT